MQGVSVLLFIGLLAKWSCGAVFLNHRPFPTYSLENMPNTQFSCREKILGGYYADPDTQCQMFHVCVKVAGIGVQDFRFLCPNGTAFDQDHQICADWEDVDCDATTLYYSSDNFDLYRVGSGFESKAHKYGEDEETFALQRAETGDARINREPQTKVVNQQRDYQRSQPRYNNFDNNNNNNNNQEKDIFKASSSSNFFNNRNNGKENDEDYDDNININQNRDYEQKRKVVRKQQRRPLQQSTQQQNQQQQTPEPTQAQTRRPQRPTGFVNNFAGSSYATSTQRAVSSTANNEQFTTAVVNNNFRRGQRQRNNNYASSSPSTNPPTPTYSISTPAPFRQSPANNGQYYTSSSTEKYSHSRATNPPVNYNTNIYDIPKITKQQTENYPSNNPQYSKPTTPFVSSSAFEKKPTNFKKIDNFKPTTFSPNAKPFSFPINQNTPQVTQNLPTTFAPRTQQAYTQIAQQTQKSQNPATFNSPSSTFNNQQKTTFAQQQFSTTVRPTSFTQYTPTVPKISSTTPVNTRSNRFDETQYDDGSYNAEYENNNNNNAGEDEFLKTAHSQNIASSRNELARAQKQQQQQSTTQKPSTAYNPTQNYPSSASRNTQVTQRPITETKPPAAPTKKVKSVSYDYAYYDSIGSEPDYQIDTEVKKTAAKN